VPANAQGALQMRRFPLGRTQGQGGSDLELGSRDLWTQIDRDPGDD
jgi:hypothetical protein